MPTTIDLAALAAEADKYVEIRDRRRKMEAETKKLKEEEESPLRAKIMKALLDSGAGAVGGTRFTFTLVQKKVPQITDWDALKAHIVKTNAFELLQRRLSGPAVKEHWDANHEVPGVAAIEVDDLSITKR